MFTGIVTDIGEVLSVEPRAEDLHRLTIACGYARAGIADGASIACSGVCLTVVGAGEDLTDMARLAFRAPAALSRFIAQKGSVALDGVSLTVNEVDGDSFAVLIIPHTLAVTTLGALRVGDPVNLEIDQMARYAARLMEQR